MRSYIDSTDKENEIRLLFNHPSYKEKVIVVIEGSSDLRIFRDIYSGNRLVFEPIDGKKDLLLVMKKLFPEFPEKLLAICDADHEHLIGTADKKKEFGVFLTDFHDIEVMMMDSPALNSYISEYSQRDNIQSIRDNLFNSAFETAYHIGLLRWANTELNLNINFKGLNFNLFIESNKLEVTINFESLYSELIKRSKSLNPIVNIDYLYNLTTNYHTKNACELQVCCGHDVTNIIAIIYRQPWASLETNMDVKKVETSLRLAYRSADFYKTNLFRLLNQYIEKLGITPITD